MKQTDTITEERQIAVTLGVDDCSTLLTNTTRHVEQLQKTENWRITGMSSKGQTLHIDLKREHQL